MRTVGFTWGAVVFVLLASGCSRGTSSAPSGGSLPVVQASGTVDAGTYSELFAAEVAFARGNDASDGGLRGRYMDKVNVVGFDASGKRNPEGRFGAYVYPQGTTVCFTDFEKNVSFLLMYDSIPHWNGSEARVYPLKETLCDRLARASKTGADLGTGFIHEDDHLRLTMTPAADPFLTGVATEMARTELDEIVSAHFLSSFPNPTHS